MTKKVLIDKYPRYKTANGLAEIIKRTDSIRRNVRYTVVKSLEEAILLISSVSESANDSMGRPCEKNGYDRTKGSIVDRTIHTLAKNRAEEMVFEMLSKDERFCGVDCDLQESLVNVLMNDSEFVSMYDFQHFHTTSGGVRYGWRYEDDDCYFVYVGYTREGTITENAEEKGMIRLPEYQMRPVISNWADEVEKIFRNKEDVATEIGKLKKWMDDSYYPNDIRSTIEFDGVTYTGYMYGNDECFELDEFYQLFLTDTEIFKMYFSIPAGNDDLGSLDYDNPYKVIKDDIQSWIQL